MNWHHIPQNLKEDPPRGLKHVSGFLVSTTQHYAFLDKFCILHALSYCSIFVALEYYNMENI